ncbi:hypothetical protein BRPE64_BCDS12230 [Caballeronia insecticola]|uniref:Lipoprotein n=2 Tax=Caballeronia insecticola TaxID=758793 RepID=R4WMY6_9BURK|nr:hypothetical protein BRPE64_BCDS12230 [Caballeronia insecticola]
MIRGDTSKMKSASNSPFKLVATVAVITALLAGCQEKHHDSANESAPASQPAAAEPSKAEVAQRAREQLLSAVSGVWKPDTGTGLTIISASGSDIQIAQGDTLLPTALGDVDSANDTVNFKIFWKSGKQEVRTITSTMDGDSTSSIVITAADGSQRRYDLVRRLSQDDLNRISALNAQGTATPSESTPAPEQAKAATDRGVIDMYLGGIDMNLRSCPGSTCAAVIIVPKDSKVSADTSTLREVTETSGVNTPWVRVTYEGAYCAPSEQDSTTGCAPSKGTDAPVIGWMNYSRLLNAPRDQS